MKKSLILFMTLWLSIGWGTAQTTFEKINEEDLSQTNQRIATSLAEKLLLGQKKDNIYLLNEEEAIPQVAKGLTEAVQRSSYESIRAQFGDYQSMKFAEAWSLSTDQGVFTIFRFKGNFTDTSDKPEVRVVLDGESRLAGFWIRPWQDDLQGKP